MRVTIYPKEFVDGTKFTLETVPRPRGTFEVDTWDGHRVTFKDKLPDSVKDGDILVVEH
jgi:hypothetical protein